ncbi:hypothetical protein BCV72DRAFT_208830, partial [Rhizopus microsporus var. microsporus]
SKVNRSFVVQALQYCLNAFDDTRPLSALVIISPEGFSSKQFCDDSLCLTAIRSIPILPIIGETGSCVYYGFYCQAR